jgi:4'-phosphopantetheinyl transferase
MAPGLLESYEALLAPDERDQHRRFAFEPRRHEYLVTRALARTVLSRYGPLPPAAWRFARGPRGRPELDPPCGLSFNLSNAPGLVACAVARHAVGVDLEPFDQGEAILALAGTVLSEAERRALEALPGAQRPGRALALWTLKEAYLKAVGAGLALPLQEAGFAVDALADITATFGPALRDRPGRWAFRLLDHAGHRVAVAAEGPMRLCAFEAVPLSPEADVAVAVEPLAW